jgi:hypothetical protein
MSADRGRDVFLAGLSHRGEQFSGEEALGLVTVAPVACQIGLRSRPGF